MSGTWFCRCQLQFGYTSQSEYNINKVGEPYINAIVGSCFTISPTQVRQIAKTCVSWNYWSVDCDANGSHGGTARYATSSSGAERVGETRIYRSNCEYAIW